VSSVQAPKGTVTFLFTDIEGSTRLASEYRATGDAQARHHAILKNAVEAHGGVVFETVGDAVYAAFSRASDALRAALRGQLELQAADWNETRPIKVRMGLHTGDVERRGDHYFGLTLVRCARLMAVGHGGQVLASQTTAELLRDELPDGASLRDLGLHKLKDILRPERVAQVNFPGLATEFPPIRTAENPLNNLPPQRTPFIGRQSELSDVRQRLLRADARLVTLTGPAGTGKTRLALQLAAEVMTEYPDGVFFVPLAGFTHATVLTTAVAEAIGVREVAGQALLETLEEALHPQKVLLVLDNFEHVVEQAGTVADLLAACPFLKVLVTSRELLRLIGEHTVIVPPMTAPDPRREWSIEQLLQFDAVRLFVDRAQAANSNFALTTRTVPHLAEICARLDGLPLAIELAAARVRVLTPQTLLERLNRTYDHRQQILTGVGPDRPVRQQTLHGAIDWSYGLLEPRAQSIFARLSIFTAGFSLEAAEAVCASANTPRSSVLEELSSLIDKSLLHQEEEPSGEPRFRMLATIREYAVERLGPAEMEDAQRQLTNYLVELAEAAEPELTAIDQVAWLDRLEREHENVRIAQRWCTATGNLELSLRLGGALWRFWSTRGYGGEGLRWLDAALASHVPVAAAVRAKALNAAGNLARELSEYSRSESLHAESLEVCRGLGNTYGGADALNNLGLIAHLQGDNSTAQRYCRDGLRQFRAVGDKGGIAAAMNNLGNIASKLGYLRRAAALHAESLGLRRDLGDRRGIALSLNNLANVVLNRGNVEQATFLHKESLALRRELGDRAGIATSLTNLGNIARAQGDARTAQQYYEEGLALQRELGDKRRVAAGLTDLGILARDHGDRERAATLLRASLLLRRELGDQKGIQAALHNLSTLALNQSDFAARVYHEETLALRRERGDRTGIAATLSDLGNIARAQGDYRAAQNYLEESLGLREELGDRRAQTQVLNELSELAVLQGDKEHARQLLTQALELSRKLGKRQAIAAILYRLGAVAHTQTDDTAATGYYSESLSLYEEVGDRRHANACHARLAELGPDPVSQAAATA
jgi:predicted ATPase/class 3 adenylate cyclase